MLPAAAVSSTSPWFAQNWGLVVTAAATLVTVALSLGVSNSSKATFIGNSAAHGGHQSLFASPKSRGGISVVQRKGRVLQEDEAVVTTPIVQYETKLQLYTCNPSLVEVGNDAHLVDETRLASALSKVDGLRQVRSGGGMYFEVCMYYIRGT